MSAAARCSGIYSQLITRQNIPSNCTRYSQLRLAHIIASYVLTSAAWVINYFHSKSIW